MNAWVDTARMIEIAEEFIEHVRKKHDGLCALLFCDNLKAHVAPEVRDVFARGNVFYPIFLYARLNLLRLLTQVMVVQCAATSEIYLTVGF